MDNSTESDSSTWRADLELRLLELVSRYVDVGVNNKKSSTRSPLRWSGSVRSRTTLVIELPRLLYVMSWTNPRTIGRPPRRMVPIARQE